MTSRARPLAVVVVLGVLLLAGCGIPGESGVTVLGPGPALGTSGGGSLLPPTQYGREATSDRATFVSYFLEAAAGDPDTALKRAQAFMTPGAAGSLKAQSGIRVVHLTDDAPLTDPLTGDVTLRYRAVGILSQHGELDPQAAGKQEQTVLKIGSLPGRSGLFLLNSPPYLMITDDVLQRFYEQHTIYFWNTEHTGLVPDIRYLPLTMPTEQAPTTILGWLIDGPATWLQNAVDPLPDGTAMKGIIPAESNDKLQITLTEEAVPSDDPRALDRLRRQVQWSLGLWLPKTLELRVGRADPVDYSDPDYLTSNFAYNLAANPERFVVFDQHIRRLAESPNESSPIPVVAAADNKAVLSAAMSSSSRDDFAALVVSEAGGREALRVGWARQGEQAALKTISLSAPISHPSWAVNPYDTRTNNATGLVSANGVIYSFTVTGGVHKVEWDGGPSHVTDVSIAPDGHRVAVLAGGKLYLAVLTAGADGMQLSTPPTVVDTVLLSEITAVDWSSEGWLAVAGLRPKDVGSGSGRVVVMDMSLDGVQESSRISDDLGDERVSYLAAYPANPTASQPLHSGSVSYVAGNFAYDALQSVLPIKVGNLAGTVTNPPAGKEPTAPFFLH